MERSKTVTRNDVLTGTPYQGAEVLPMDHPLREERIQSYTPVATILEACGKDGAPLDEVGVVVLEVIDGLTWDSATPRPSRSYWLVKGREVLQLPEGAHKHLKVREAVGWFDASDPERARFDESFAPLRALAEHGGVKHPKRLQKLTKKRAA